ncbi:MAG: prolipoprotein diacylglyceryl transferase [Rhodospirillales bacterium CG15_BIG_FIL_POST_REV_8_21_14_020_66_15]|nr:MAG: prolipoprotein diacylglyceryl transferase [Rhodospirillales bacterium CG15_BIG_FIL_POST_REV_8_21_14_020_66_15]
MTFALAFPAIDPIAIEIGPIAIRWYALAYIAGLILGWRYMLRMTGDLPLRDVEVADEEAEEGKTKTKTKTKTKIIQEPVVTRLHVDDFLVWATVGVVLGGRLGYVLFYKPGFYLEHPLNILTVWQGGMSFHGGLLGVCVATVLFCRKREVPLFTFADMMGCAAPIGLLFGRIANFVNGELFGRPADVPWAMVFPHGGPIARHPSQIYEALLEGLLLFVVLAVLRRRPGLRARPGFLAGAFFAGYGAARITAEFFREPDAHLGFLFQGATMGQLLSLPMIAFGLWLIRRSGRAPKAGA